MLLTFINQTCDVFSITTIFLFLPQVGI